MFTVVFIMAVAIGIGVYFLSHYLSYDYINTVYSSGENKKSREMSYIRDLQDYVNDNEISSENTAKLSEWARENKYVYLIMYKDNELFYTSDDKPKEDPDEPAESEPGEGETGENDPEDPDGEEEGESGADKGDSSADSGDNGEDAVPDDKNPGGVTIDYPTREELFEYARKNDLHPVELADGTMLASLTEFTEYLYYDISNIASISIALFVVLTILTFYFHTVTRRIIKLGNEVNRVADGDSSHVIKAKGNDEISRLSVNVENMRTSMIENFEKEREAIAANNALITSMSHDIRTPLTVLLGYIDVMQTRCGESSEMQEYLKAAESTAMRLKKLSDDMFSYFLVFGGKELEINIESYDAATLIDQMLFEHITLMRESGYEVDFSGIDYDGLQGKEICTDAQKLIRIFDNVFSNIYKNADQGAPVSITVKEEAQSICIRFSNSISEMRDRVESNGIGLKTCKKLAERIHASFEYESDEKTFCALLELDLYRTAGNANN